MKIIIRLLYSIVVTLFSTLVTAQNTIPPLNYLTTENGLSQALNYDIFQDSRGYMWFTSYDGLNRFDSHEVKKFTYDYNNPDSFSGTISLGIVEDTFGNIWSGSNVCLNVFEVNKNRFKHIQRKENPTAFYNPLFAHGTTVVFQKGNLFFGCDSKTYKTFPLFTDTSEAYSNFTVSCFETQTFFYAFITDKSLTQNRFKLYEFDKSDLTKIRVTSFNTPQYKVNCFWKLNDLEFIGGTNKGLCILNYRTKKIKPLSILKNESVLSINSLGTTSVLIATTGGKLVSTDFHFTQITPLTFTSEKDRAACQKFDIRKITTDKNENLFFSLWGKGIAYCNVNNSLFRYYFTPADIATGKIKDQYIAALLALKDNSILVATRSDGLYQINTDGKILNRIPYPKGQSSGEIFLQEGLEGQLLMTGFGGVYRIAIENRQIIPLAKHPLLEENDIYHITPFENNSYLLSTRKGILSSSADFKLCHFVEGLPKNELCLRSYWIDQKYLVICKPFKGFAVYQKKGAAFSSEHTFTINATIKDMYLKNNTEVWFASTVGLIKYNLKQKKAQLDNDRNRWINTYFYAVTPDDNQNLWISHNSGITRYSIPTGKTVHFGLNHGLQGYEFNTNAFAKTPSGYLFFGGTNGLNAIYPDKKVLKKNLTQFRLEEFKISDQPRESNFFLESQEKVSLSYNKNSFSFTPVLINYGNNLLANEFLYRLNGVDAYWLKGKSGQLIRYSNLPAGDFKLELKTLDGTEQFSAGFHVGLAFWKSVWFWILVSLVLTAMVWFVQRGYYLARVKEKEVQIQKMKAIQLERERIAHDMHDDLGSGLTAISYLSQDRKEETFGKIQEKSRELIKNMSEIIWSMKAENDTVFELISYIKRYAFNYGEENGLDIKFTISVTNENQEISGDIRKNIYLIVKEALHNTVKHAKASRVNVTIQCDTTLYIAVQDDGIGFIIDPTNYGNGIKNIRKRAERINGTVLFETQKGTKIMVKVPL